ncbi:unnamed protein product [Ectocarpus sp. CCAP 1310/34]|nr:unnamed protein product [Ectocarpus sp. CCAP 1310/34]
MASSLQNLWDEGIVHANRLTN